MEDAIVRLVKLAVAGGLLFVAWCTGGNLIDARNHSRQKQIMADMRTIATAWEARATDINSYSVGLPNKDGQRVSPAQLAAVLEPKYVKKLPRRDPWGSEYELSLDGFTPEGAAQVYAIRAYGSDKRADLKPPGGAIATHDFASDIVYSNGSFVQYPVADG